MIVSVGRGPGITRRGMLGAGALLAGALMVPPASARGLPSYPRPDEERLVTVPGGRAYVRVNGRLDGSRPPAVFIHGGPGVNHASLLETLALADQRAVVLYDQLDCGLSDRPGDPANWTVARYVDELEAIRAALALPRWHVFGHSWGGTIALEYAARHGDRLASVVLAGPLISTRSWIADAEILRRTMPADVQAGLTDCERPRPSSSCFSATAAYYGRYLAREPVNEAYLAYVAEDPRLGFNAAIYEAVWGPNEFVASGVLRDYDGEPLLAKLPGGRTLFLGGEYDEARPETLAGFAARVDGAETVEIAGAGHAIFGDRPEEACAVLREWFLDHDGYPQ